MLSMEAPVGYGLGGAMFKLPGMLEGLLRHHGAVLPRGTEDEILLIKRDLEEITTILKEGRSTTVFSCWTKEVRELSYDMEDFIDEYEHARSRFPTPHRYRKLTLRRRSRSKATPSYWLREQLRHRLWMANKIREFSVRVQEALQRHTLYNLGSTAANVSGGCASSSSCHPTPYFHDEVIVGIDATMDKLEEWLMTTHSDEHQKLRVVSVVGPGGVGKTTIANELYSKLSQHFECRAFVWSSQKPDIRKLFIRIISQLGLQQTPNDWTVHNLISTIRSHLQYKRYLIILDELWCTSKWDIIKCVLPDDNCCSRILIMTEIEDLALHCCGYDSTYVLKLKPLGEDESRKLFFCSIFGPQGECPPELREVLFQIIRKCGGLPLAIVMVARLLASQKETQEQWDHVNKSLGYSLITNSTREGMKQVLSLSYNSLPEHLKACILYMSIYKEDTIIWKDDLVNQWTAEGFICTSQGQDEQEIAAAYFDELLSRKIIQPVDIKDDGEVLSCVFHNMVLNDIAAHKSVEENFVTAIHNSQTTTVFADKIRRLSLHFGDAEDAIQLSNMRLSQVRTIAFFGVFKFVPSIMEFQLLKVLILHFWGDKDNISLDLTGISELFRLRYLKVSSNVTLELKAPMQGLKNLETIKIDAKVSSIPSEFTQLTGLLHFSFPAETDLPSGISHISSLRTLGYFDIASNSLGNFQSLNMLSNLQDLKLTCSINQPDYLMKTKILILLSLIIKRLNNLKSLTLQPTASYENSLYQSGSTGITVSSDNIRNAFNTLTLLQRFEFSPHLCMFSCLPKRVGQLTKLSILKIGVKKLASNCVDVLKGLPALSVLSLYVHCKPAETIVIGKTGFPVLKYFMFKCCDPVLKFDTGAMPNLRKLLLCFNAQRADQQVTVPFGIEHLSGLKELYAEVGGAGSEEPDSRATELAFRDAVTMRMHGRFCRVIVTCVNKIFGCKDDQSSVQLEPEGASLKRCKMEDVSDDHDHNVEGPVKEAVDDADSRFVLSEWNMLLLLKDKVHNQNDGITSCIPVVDPYSMDPWNLAEIGIGTQESRLYFRPLQEAKDGPAPSGYWRETGSAGYIYSAKGLPMGMKRTMEFCQGSAALDKRTLWKMKEFTAIQESTAGAVDGHLTERGEVSLCQLYTKQNAEVTKAEKTRKRKKPIVTKTMAVTCEDGFSWRKYGEKTVTGSMQKISYYRCTHRHSQGCEATKHVQPTDSDPYLIHVVYHGEHTCDKGKTEHSMEQSRLSISGCLGATASSSPQAPPIKPLDNQLSMDDLDAIKVIGKGSSGIVQLVRHKLTGQLFALKVVQLSIQEDIRRQIVQELKISLSTQCQYVVMCYQCFSVNGTTTVVLEYMDGGSLADFLKTVKIIPESYLAAICRQVLRGLIYLHHEKCIIHRDLKPSNILINHRGEVKISDFGISAIVSSSSAEQDTFTGTYKYVAPERISGQKYDFLSDIWSLGMVILECATGNFPYPACESFYELLEAVVDKPPPSASPEQFSDEFCSFISACMQKDVRCRSSAQILLGHPFLSMYDDLNVDLASYFTTSGGPITNRYEGLDFISEGLDTLKNLAQDMNEELDRQVPLLD